MLLASRLSCQHLGLAQDDDVRLRDQQIPPGTEMVAAPEPHSWQFETFCVLSASTHQTFRNAKIQTRRALPCNQETSVAQRRAWHVPFCFHARHQWEGFGLIRRNQTDRSSHKLPSETVATIQKMEDGGSGGIFHLFIHIFLCSFSYSFSNRDSSPSRGPQR